MANQVETQAFLDEAKAPSIITAANIVNALKLFVPKMGGLSQQFALMSQQIQSARIVEDDEPLYQMMEEGRQKAEAIKRQTVEAGRAVEEIARTLREWKDWENRFRTEAANHGYTI